MKTYACRVILLTALIGLWAAPGFARQGNPGFDGKWTLIREKSSEISLYRTLSLEIHQTAGKVKLLQIWGTRRSFKDTLELKTGGVINKVRIKSRIFPGNVFMGLSMPVGEFRKIRAHWQEDGRVLILQEQSPVRGSQGLRQLKRVHTYSLSPGGETLVYEVHRSSRETGPPQRYVLKRAGLKNAYVMFLQDNWAIDGKLAENAFLISLQGLANQSGANLYFVYPKTWNFNYTKPVYEFYKNKLNYTFKPLRSAEQALRTFKNAVRGYVVWDPAVRTSLIVAFTIAGLEKAVVATQAQIPMLQRAGLAPVADLRGKFEGQTDAQIYQWAYDHYWDRCSRDFVIWMGGEHGKIMKPGVADWGIYQKAFFSDLSTKPRDKEEYALAKKILSQMKPMSMVMGWHSYKKDLERDFVKLTSSYGLRVEGLHTLPNLSFSSQVRPTRGFKFKNHHNLVPGRQYIPKKKVYITCVQSDGLGLGAWTKPGRGEIPYAWQVIMNYYWLAPAMMEFFYSQATPNDYFIGGLSGPGYMYPKAVPPDMLPKLIQKSYEFMQKLDLQVFEIMDYSEGATVEGNTDLTRRVAMAYFKGMPDAIGFINGYAPSFTFTVQDGRPLISYDYYLSPSRPAEEAVADLQELAKINNQRPYFLLMHVRESSDIKRVKSILDRLGDEFELVPLDIFLKMAGTQPTFKERFRQE